LFGLNESINVDVYIEVGNELAVKPVTCRLVRDVMGRRVISEIHPELIHDPATSSGEVDRL